MPETPIEKIREHPVKRPALDIGSSSPDLSVSSSLPPYAELQVASNFSFLRGASHPDELAIQAAAMGCRAIAVTDLNTLAGVVRAHVAAKEMGIQFVVGCRVELAALRLDALMPRASMPFFPFNHEQHATHDPPPDHRALKPEQATVLS